LTRHHPGRLSPSALWGGSFDFARILQLFRAGFRAEAAKPVERRCYERKHRVTPCRKQRCAPFPARLEPPGATRGPALLPSPGLPWDLGAGARNGRSPSPDHRISRFAPGRIYVVRHPCAAPDSFALRLRGPTRRRPMDRAGPSAPKTGDYVDWDAWLLTRFPTPNPGRPVPTPDPKVTFGASPVKSEAAMAADGRHPWSRPLVPSRFRNRIDSWRRCESSSPASRRRASTSPISRETCSEGMRNLSVPTSRKNFGPPRYTRSAMKRGSIDDFWRAVRVGYKLMRFGWRPWQLDIGRNIPLRVQGRSSKGFQYATAHRTGCHAGVVISTPLLRKLPKLKQPILPVSVTGNGFDLEIDRDRVAFHTGISSVSDIEHFQPRGTFNREGVTRLFLSPDKRARLIQSMLPWLKMRQRRGWSALSMTFRRTSCFRAAGLRWELISDLFFARHEGYYWNNYLWTKHLGRPQFDRLQRAGFFASIQQDLKKLGFRIHGSDPGGIPFDQDFLPSLILEKKARLLAEWRPRTFTSLIGAAGAPRRRP